MGARGCCEGRGPWGAWVSRATPTLARPPARPPTCSGCRRMAARTCAFSPSVASSMAPVSKLTALKAARLQGQGRRALSACCSSQLLRPAPAPAPAPACCSSLLLQPAAPACCSSLLLQPAAPACCFSLLLQTLTSPPSPSPSKCTSRRLLPGTHARARLIITPSWVRTCCGGPSQTSCARCPPLPGTARSAPPMPPGLQPTHHDWHAC